MYSGYFTHIVALRIMEWQKLFLQCPRRLRNDHANSVVARKLPIFRRKVVSAVLYNK